MLIRLSAMTPKPTQRYMPSSPGRPTRGCRWKDLCRRHGFSEGSYYLWRSKFGGVSVSDAKRRKELESENGRLKKLLTRVVGNRRQQIPYEVDTAALPGCPRQHRAGRLLQAVTARRTPFRPRFTRLRKNAA